MRVGLDSSCGADRALSSSGTGELGYDIGVYADLLPEQHCRTRALLRVRMSSTTAATTDSGAPLRRPAGDGPAKTGTDWTKLKGLLLAENHDYIENAEAWLKNGVRLHRRVLYLLDHGLMGPTRGAISHRSVPAARCDSSRG